MFGASAFVRAMHERAADVAAMAWRRRAESASGRASSAG
jgi:hypothetical protein